MKIHSLQIASRVVSSMIGLAIAIFMIYLGETRKDECPAEPMVPTFLIGESYFQAEKETAGATVSAAEAAAIVVVDAAAVKAAQSFSMVQHHQ